MKLLREETFRCVRVEDRIFKRFLRFPVARDFEEAMEETATWTREWFDHNGRPWLIALTVDEATRKILPDRWPDAKQLAIVIASAGPEAEKAANTCWENDEPDRYYFLECYAAAVVDQLLTQTRNELGASTHYSPGYAEWSIDAHVPLLAAIERATTLPGPLRALDSGMLSPKKSQLAVFALPSA